MTKLLFALSLLSFAFAQAQQEIPKGSNQIVVKNITLNMVVNTLLDNNFAIDKLDTTFHIVSTVPRADKNGSSYIFYFRVKDSTAIITGTYKVYIHLSALNQTFEPIQFTGWKTGANRIFFEMMNDFAKKLGTDIGYATVK